ncbi:IS110 family transposase [Luteococcus sanguinis]|uniref:IS110 family transposase n=1 Tax=Luteococcus sanguinis TaxID=174038 RepID=A0ABW1X2D7_9ACTN
MYAGIDTHKDTLAVAVVDHLGTVKAIAEHPNTHAGYAAITAMLTLHHVERIGIEGSANYGRCISAHLALETDRPWQVLEVPTLRTSRERAAQPSRGKTDPIDATVIARITLRDNDLPPVRYSVGPAADLRSLIDYRDDLMAERTALANRAHMDLMGLFPGYQKTITTLTQRRHLNAAIELVTNDPRNNSGTRLTQIYGVGPLVAARFLALVVDVNRYPNRDTFASANGTAPIPASSGRTVRYRFNRGGNRQLNRCLYTIALTQIRADTPGRIYYQRKISEGKTSKEALRCLKRKLSDTIYNTMRRDQQPVTATSPTYLKEVA